MRKMTFTLDEATAREIDRAADRLDIPKSQVVREAVQLYGVEQELAEVRKARRRGGRGTSGG
jgi:predicted transcriptional regulator